LAIQSEIMRRLVLQEQTKTELDKQISFKKTIEEMEKDIRSKKERTSFGPEEDRLLYEILDSRKVDAKQSTKQDLQHLIKERESRHDFMNKLERSLDQNMVEQMVQAFHEEQRERKALEHQRKLDLRHAWIEQAMINEKVRNIENLFN
jgi:hypothetical protein